MGTKKNSCNIEVTKPQEATETLFSGCRQTSRWGKCCSCLFQFGHQATVGGRFSTLLYEFPSEKCQDSIIPP
eukprot:1160964-Pelagomonas_calceolata.AAC.12